MGERCYDPTAWERFGDLACLLSLYEQTGWTGYRLRNRQAIEQALADCGPGATVLDGGCFVGLYSEPVVAALGGYTGVDITPKFVAAARQRYPGLDFRLGDIRDLAFPDASFDVVLSFGTLIHLPEVTRPLAELSRVSRRILLVEATTVEEPDRAVDLEEDGEQYIVRAYGLGWLDAQIHSLPGRVTVVHRQPWRTGQGPSGPMALSSTLWRVEQS